jgi:hypothetical protein
MKYAVYVLSLKRALGLKVNHVLKIGITTNLDRRINYRGVDEPYPIFKTWDKKIDVLHCTEYKYDEDTALMIEKSLMDTIALSNNSYYNGKLCFHDFYEEAMLSGITELRKYTPQDAYKAVTDLKELEMKI